MGVASQIVRLAEYLKMEYPEGSPELAVEIVSPSNTKKKLAEKIELYLANGSLAVWVVYPKKRTVVLWESGGKKSEFGEGDILCLPTAISDRADSSLRDFLSSGVIRCATGRERSHVALALKRLARPNAL